MRVGISSDINKACKQAGVELPPRMVEGAHSMRRTVFVLGAVVALCGVIVDPEN